MLSSLLFMKKLPYRVGLALTLCTVAWHAAAAG
jgi:hypothetical protein